MANLIYLIAAALVLTSCGLALPHNPPPSQVLAKVQPVAGDGPITGQIQSLDNQTLDLAQNPKNIQVVMFVSDTCSICRHETAALVADRIQTGKPKNVDFYSILLGEKDDAVDWQADLKVDWNVGVDPGNALYKKYCVTEGKEDPTPCILLHNPTLDRRTKLVGDHSLSELEEKTGRWERQ